MINENEIKVSVFCTCYNHENYIRDCLDGFIMQETDFEFEVLVHDDASTDNSANIIKEYEMKYPDIIKPIYQTVNQYSQDIDIASDILLPKAKGKYIAFCEGDDFWTDKHKLQMQFDVLERNINCSISVHKVSYVDVKDNKHFRYAPNFALTDELISKDNALKTILVRTNCFHTSSIFVTKTSYFKYLKFRKEYFYLPKIGDYSMYVYYSLFGGFTYIDKVMSVYRCGISSGATKTFSLLDGRNIKDIQTSIDSFEKLNKFTNFKYNHEIDTKISDLNNTMAKLYFKEFLEKSHKIRNYQKHKKEISMLSFKEKRFCIVVTLFPHLYSKYIELRGNKW